MPFEREMMKQAAAELAAQGIFIGTSSWKYEGWFGQLYTPARYEYRGKVAKTRFERDCLGEYAEVFKTVCVDAAYCTLRERYGAQADRFQPQVMFARKVGIAITEMEKNATPNPLYRFTCKTSILLCHSTARR